jgi:nitrogen-specific signal transduction histidine kinase
MNPLKQYELRQLAERMVHSEDPDNQALAQGTLELLDYVEELANTLEFVTEECCEAISLSYEYDPSPQKLHPQDASDIAPWLLTNRAA